MPIRRVKSLTNAQRGLSFLDTSELSGKRPERRLVVGKRKTGGRNNLGRLTMRRRGGGAKQNYRKVDFLRSDKDGVPARVVALEYDPNRNARLHLLHYADGEKRYVVAPLGVAIGATVHSGAKAEPKPGNNMPLRQIPVGLPVHNIELVPGRGAALARSAGTLATLGAKEGDYALITLPSTEMRRVHLDCRATVGQVGNLDANLVKWGKAGRTRHRGRRPKVRGSAMNPVSHPMGGGEGRRAGGRHPMSPWGVLAKGGKTRHPRKQSNRMIVRGRRRGKQVGS